MTDQTVGLAGVLGRWGRVQAAAARLVRRDALSPAAAWAVAGLMLAAMARHFWQDEGELSNILFTAAVTAALVALLMLVSRRALFASIAVTALVVVIVAAS